MLRRQSYSWLIFYPQAGQKKVYHPCISLTHSWFHPLCCSGHKIYLLSAICNFDEVQGRPVASSRKPLAKHSTSFEINFNFNFSFSGACPCIQFCRNHLWCAKPACVCRRSDQVGERVSKTAAVRYSCERLHWQNMGQVRNQKSSSEKSSICCSL